jgi:hypothetical protein
MRSIDYLEGYIIEIIFFAKIDRYIVVVTGFELKNLKHIRKKSFE